MRREKTFPLIILTGLVVFYIIPSAMTVGPRTNKLSIHIYYNPDVENQDLDLGILDINDWPLSSDWITKWSTKPDTITMRSYVANDMFEFDLNNQMWPTGWLGYNNLTGDPHFNASWHFRKALAHLTNKTWIVNDLLKGYGYKIETPIPPSMQEYQWPELVPYNYSRVDASAELAEGGFYREGGLWKWNGEALPKLKIYLKLDDPYRRTACEYLVTELRAIDFTDAQLDVKIIEQRIIGPYDPVMTLYDYHINTGHHAFSPTPEHIYDLYHSTFYFGWGAPSVGWAPNYVGFCNRDYDIWAEKVKTAPNDTALLTACWNATKILHELVPVIPLWSNQAVKACRAGSTGVVNEDGYGIDNAYTFLRMSGTTTVDSQIDYGFKSEPEQLHVIASQWLWDWNVLNLVYDSLIRRNPYEQSQVECFLATNVSVGTWEMDGGELGTELTFDLRDSVKWHDGMPFTAQDVVFSWNFTKACSPRVAWNYAFVTDMNNSWVSGPNQVKIRYDVLSMFAKWWAGSLPIIPKHIWEGRFPDWNQPTFNPSIVRAYHPWEVEKVVSNETLTEMVGTGPWKYPLGG